MKINPSAGSGHRHYDFANGFDERSESPACDNLPVPACAEGRQGEAVFHC